MASPDTCSCTVCHKLRRQYNKALVEPNFFLVHLDVCVLTEKIKKSERKRRKLKEIEKIVSALRNTEGGDVLLHLSGQTSDDKYLGHLDDFLDNSLNNLIPDGKLFIDSYTRQWLHEWKQFEQFLDVVLLKVTKTPFISTVDFKTKVSSDFKIERASTINIVSILSSDVRPQKAPPKLRGLDQYSTLLHENRRTELKVYKPSKEIESVGDFVDYVWQDLRFKENLSCLSKVKEGGSFFLGINELRDTKKPYESKIIELWGVDVPGSVTDLRSSLLKKIKDEAAFLSFDGDLLDVPDDLVEVELHRFTDKDNTSKFILEIAVGCVEGIVFYEKKGPETYTIQDGIICRMDFKEWLRRIQMMSIETRFSDIP